MADFCIRIKSRPPGGAPENIRDAWIGVIMPAIEMHGPLADVLTHRREPKRNGGYGVSWTNAMRALGEGNPQARAWWESNTSGGQLIFAPECCEIVPD
jgi:hypothetical protein